MAKPVTLSVWVDRTLLDEAKLGAEDRGTTIADEVRKVVARLATQKRRKPQKGRAPMKKGSERGRRGDAGEGRQAHAT